MRQMQDGQLVGIAQEIDKLNARIRRLVERIRISGRDDAQEIFEGLQANDFDNPALAQAIVHKYVNPKDYVWTLGGAIHNRRTAEMDLQRGLDIDYWTCGPDSKPLAEDMKG